MSKKHVHVPKAQRIQWHINTVTASRVH